MATIQKRGEYQYQVEIRRKGYPRQTRTFESKAQAEAWAREQEHKMDMGQFRDLRPMAQVTLDDALGRYMEQVVPTKAPGGQRNERNRIRLLKKHPLAQRLMTSLLAADFVAYRDERLREVDSPNTVRLELALLSHLYTTAIKEWSWPLVHVMKDVKRPSPREGRERRLVADEELRLLEAARHESVRKPLWLEACIRIALETGLRACELLTLRWSQVDLSNGVVSLTKAINGSKRSVGLSYEATGLMNQLARDGERVVRGYFETGKLDCDFKAACVAAGIADLHFHDLRHEAASRFAPHMMPQELAKIMGWKTLQMAMRYYNPSAQEIAQRVRQVEASRAGSMPKPPMAPLGGEVRKVALQDGLADSLMSGRTVLHDEANVIRVAFGGSGVNRAVA
ncbi:tyrosine-type recombinase/integrase [Achromobacter spanius]|uniref:tyrosine-type recombinase/integrase n=1 Tax=Achromobacter spanius TaxID=217203 RepID=UPI00067D74BF|nr:site-specific integrase [Achromobacter spanius]